MENNPEEEYSFALNRSLKLLSRRPYAATEIYNYLIKKKISEGTIEKVIKRLFEVKFLDEKAFAKWWVEQRQRFRPKGKIVLKQELKNKGITDNIIEQTLHQTQDDFQTALEFFKSKKYRFEKYTGDKYKKKVADYLGRRGFSWEIIIKVLKEESK